MSFFDSIRSFFGLPPRNDRRNERPQTQPHFWNFTIEGNESNDQDDFVREPFGANMDPNGDDFGFRMFSGNILDMHRFFEQQFDDLLKGFQSNWFSEGFNFDNNMMLEPPQVDDNPRNKFLKPSYVQPPSPGSSQNSALVDDELQQEVPPSKILELFPDKGEEKRTGIIQPFTSTRSIFSSQTIRKKILPHGGIEEERRSIRDGKEETKISRELGGMRHILITTKLPDGTTQIHEEFVNMDEDKLPEFNKAWSKL